jgi:fructokinase
MKLTTKSILTSSRPTKRKRPALAGVGMIAQDVVIQNGVPTTPTAGGSCGNVMALAAWLGWSALPIGRLGDDPPGIVVRADLERVGVQWDHMRHEPGVETPVVIQEFVPNAQGQIVHRFRFACPTCRGWLPRYTPPTISMVREALARQKSPPDALYFDRACPAALDAAKTVQTNSGIVMFEPCGLGDPKLFQRALALSTVVKYSSEHTKKFASLLDKSIPMIEIETLGAEGLRFRTYRNEKRSKWTHLDSYPVARHRDAAGAGDACSAGFLFSLARLRTSSRWSVRRQALAESLRFGQAFASINCSFIGARGMMRAMAADEAIRLADAIVARNQPRNLPEAPTGTSVPSVIASCNSCLNTAAAVPAAR